MQLDQVRAVVTGGASGLGFAVAKHLAAHGAKVALLDVNDEKGHAAAAEIGASYFRGDVTDESAIVATRTPIRANSRAIGSVMPTTPPFEAE
jgi:NAD(P)-dependent dehydrogenase (short-subunit alcohol dehydrogenase family)